MSSVVVIPAYQPNESLIDLVNSLIYQTDYKIIIVNDGSDSSCNKIFNTLKAINNNPSNNSNDDSESSNKTNYINYINKIDILHHAVNLGKGAALKTAFTHYILNYSSKYHGLVTADADGQHKVEDIINTVELFNKNTNSMILGCRVFNKQNVPLRSKIGNIVTKKVFKFITGNYLSDTQSGLRAIPNYLLKDLLKITSNRYEFELDMLIYALENNIDIKELPIKTVYLNNNNSSHFNPVIDSLRIYFVFLRFLTSSLLTTTIDYAVFVVTYKFFGYIFLAESFARIIALNFNFRYNKKHVFKSNTSVNQRRRELFKYIALVTTMLFLSYALITVFVLRLGMNVYIAKILSATVLFISSFSIQKTLIFNTKQPKYA